MEQCSPLGWVYCGEQEGAGELKRFLVQTTMELEATVMAAQDEMSRKEEEMSHMRGLLMAVVKERDEAQYKCQKLLLEKLSLQQQLQQMHNTGSFFRVVSNNTEDNKAGSIVGRGGDTNNNNHHHSLSSDESEESIISDSANPQLPSPSSSSTLPPHQAEILGTKRALPEKGKLLQAVMEAGPTLQTLLLAGPLPQWQHPPPQLDSVEIPPVTIPASPVLQSAGMLMHQDSSSCLVNNTTYANNKRGLDTFDTSVSSPTSSKYQRVG